MSTPAWKVHKILATIEAYGLDYEECVKELNKKYKNMPVDGAILKA